MTAKKKIEEGLEKLARAIRSDDELVENVMSRIAARPVGESGRIEKVSAKLIARRLIMNRFTKFAAAGMLIASAVLIITILDKSATPAYGITDLPELIKNARTMHMKGWFYSSQAEQKNGEPVKLEFDYWFDIENGRYRLYKPGGIDKDTGKPKYFITVSDGQYVMSSAFKRSRDGRTWKSISFTKLSPFKARLETYKTYGSLMQMFGNIDQIKGSTKVGQEKIDGIVFDIWQTEFYLVNGFGNRIRTWLASESGDIGRVLFWQTRTRQNDEEDLRLIFDLHTIELGVVPPEGIFDTTPPDGYELDNTKETALTDTLGIDPQKGCQKDYELHSHIGFTLRNGSVIIGWSCPNKTRRSQADLFKNLAFGGKLPELAAKIESLTSIPDKQSVEYAGHHLAYTQKDGIFYEWTLYVPDEKPPARNSLLGYNLNVIYQVDESKFGDRSSNLMEDLAIDADSDFDTWVRGAMAWLSDDGMAPEQVNYNNVLRLVEQIRRSKSQ